MRRIATLAATLAATTGLAQAQTDVWQSKLNEYTRNGYRMTVLAKTPDVVLVYLCQPRGHGWFAFKLTSNAKDADFELRAGAEKPYRVAFGPFGQHGQGVYYVNDGARLFHGPGAAQRNHRGLVALSIADGPKAASRRVLDVRLTGKAIGELTATCQGR